MPMCACAGGLLQVIKYYADKVVALQANKPAADVAKQINSALASN